MSPKDITIIGSGIATSVALIEVFNELLSKNDISTKLSIAVIEKNHDFWKGVPYSSRSSVNALVITSVYDFVNEAEQPLFFGWLKTNLSGWTSYYLEHGGAIAASWLERNMAALEASDWKNLYVPRFLFGNYIAEKLQKLLRSIEEKQLATVELIQAEAIDVAVLPEGNYEITIEYDNASQSNITTKKLVVSVGSPPVRTMYKNEGNKVLYVNDIYIPSFKENFNLLEKALSIIPSVENRNVLFIGSNASSIELLYHIQGTENIRSLINKAIIISPSGILPYPASTNSSSEFPLPNIDKVKSNGSYTIIELVEAASNDIKLALVDGANMDYITHIINNTLKLLEVLSEDDKKAFYAIHAIKLRDSFRRAGLEYRGSAQALIDLKKVELLKGKFLDMVTDDAGMLMIYSDGMTKETETFPLPFAAVINCSGSDDLIRSSSRLLYNLSNKQICKPNLSGKGFEVTETFEAAPNLYIFGPMLGGNMNKLIHFWQLENASRLTSLAPYLAKELVGRQ